MSQRNPSKWEQIVASNPDHSTWYIERFRAMAAEGADLHGEARFVDAMVPRGARILDAGCGPGRVGGELARRGHAVVGVDVDPVLIAAAEADYPEATWLVGDISELDLTTHGITQGFDAIVVAGNVMTFLAPSSEPAALDGLGRHLAPGGRIVVGFGTGRGYGVGQFLDDVATAGLREQLRLGTWDLRPFTESSDFIVSVLGA